MKPSDLSEFFSLLGKAKKEKEEEFDNLLKEADINLDDLTSSLVSGIKEAKEDQKKQKKNEEKLIEQLDSIIDVIENPKEVKDITEPAVTVGVPEDFDVSKLEEEDALDVQDWNGGKDVKFTEVDAVDIVKPEPIKTPEISDTVAQAIKFIEETNIKEEIENSDETNLDKLKTEIKQVRDILYKVLAHGPGSGEVNLLKLDDVDTTDLGDEKVLSYDASTEKLKFVEQSGGSGVSTENVRTGILDVAGIATFRNNTLVGTGITLSPDGDIFVTGVTTATKFVGDGSGLTGITASGSGVVIQDEGSAIGTAATINFIGSNVTAALSGGIANVTVTPGITTANVRTGILDVAGIATFRNDTLIGSGITLSPDGDIFATGVTTSSSFVGDLTGDVTGTASNATQLNSQAASYYLDYDNFSNTPTIPSNNNQLTNGAGFITASDDITGNAATSTKLATARTIAGVSFDGSANISLNNNAITNGAGYITTSFTNTNQLTNGAGFITASDDITGNAATATALANARTIAGVSFDGSANISLNNNAITNGAGYITGSALNASNLSSGTIPDARFPSTLPAIDGSALTGIAVTDNIRTNTNATFLQNVNVSGTTTATTFIGNLTGNVTGNVSGTSGSTTGNAATATALANARTIGGVSFDGSANIDLPGVNSAGNQDTTGNAATATKLAATKTIAGVAFDGSSNISLNNNAITNGAGYITATLTDEEVQDKVGAMFTGNTETGITATYQDADGTIDLVVGTLNQDTTGNAATATALETARNIGGVSFDGSANIDLPGVNSAGNQNTTGTSAGLTGTPSITVNAVNGATGTFSGNVTIGGVLTYEDVTNVDSIGVITARSGVLVGSGITLSPDGDIFTVGVSTFKDDINLPDNVELKLGSVGEVRLLHNGSATNFIVSQHYFNMQANGYNLYSQNGSESIITAYQNGAVNLFFDNTKRFETTNTGITVTGTAVATSFTGDLTGDVTGSISGGTVAGSTGTFTSGITTSLRTNKISLGDNERIHCGIGSDLEIYHSGNHSFIKEKGTGSLFISSNQFNAYNQAANEKMIVATQNSSVELYHDNTLRLTTSDSGAEITGDLETTSDVKVGSGITLSPDGDGFFTGVTTSTTFVGALTGNVTGNASGSSGSCTGNAATATALETARTIAGVSFDGTGNISLNNNAITNGAGYITATLTDEQVQDIVGAMFSSNTETGITATYQDADGTIDLVVGTLNQDTTGNAATATALETARNIGGVSFDGSANIDLPGVNSSGNQDTSGNAATATKLAATKTIAGVAFDGSANISLNNNAITNGAGYITATLTNEQVQDIVGGMVSSNTETGITVTYQDDDGTLDFVVGTLNQDTTGNAATATALETARNIGGVSFDGSANIDLPGVNSAGNQNTSGTAAGLSGTPNISCGTIAGSTGSFSGNLSITNKIIHAGDVDTSIAFPDADTFTVDTGGSERLRITSAGDVGIGYNSPTVKLHVREAASGASSYDNRHHIIIEDDSEAYLGFYLPDNGYGGIRFYDTTGQEGLIDYYFDTDDMHFSSTGTHIFKTAGSERLRITSGGFIGAGTANPRRQFHLHNSESATVGFQMTNGNTGESNDSQGFQLKVGSDSHAEISQMENSYLAIFTNATEKLRITSGGQVNIGDDFTQTTYKTQIEATDNNVLRLVNDSDDTNGVELVLYKDSASAADGDNIGGIYFQGNDDAGNSVFYANIEGLIDDASDGTEDGYIRFRTRKNGSIGERVRIQSNGEVTMTSSGSLTDALANLHVQNDTFRVSNNDDGADTTYIHLHSHSDGTDADRHVYRQVTDSVIKAAIDQSGRVMGHSHHYAGRTRTDENSPSNVYTHANSGFFAYSARTDDASNYRTTCHMRAWDSGDVADRNAFYLVDSQDDTTTADYDQHQRFGIKANGMTQAREDIWSGRCESDEGSPNSVYTAGNTNLVRSYATNSNAQSYMLGVAVPATNIYCFYAETGTSNDDDDVQFRVRSTDGRVQTDAGSVQTGGADYAEFFEWEDGNPSNEDRVGTSVVLVGEKIRAATSSDDPSKIIGIISATPCVVGDSAALKYHDRYLKDDWGRDVLEEVEMLVWNIGQNEHQPKQTDTFALTKADECCRVSDIESYLAEGRVPQWAVDQNLRRIDKVRKVNPNFDVNKKDTYEPREDRKEWDAVGLVGKLCMKKGQPTGTNWIKLSDKTASIERWLVR